MSNYNQIFIYISKKKKIKWIALTFSIQGIFKKSSNRVSNDWISCLLALKSLQIVFALLKPVFSIRTIQCTTDKKQNMDQNGPKLSLWPFFGDFT